MRGYNIAVVTLFLSARGGQAALSFVFLVGAVTALIATTLGFLAVSFITTSSGFQASERALAAASAGASDGLLQLVRNRDFSDIVGYTVPVGSDSALITVTQNVPAGQATILSSGGASAYRRTFRVVVSVEALTGQIRIISWRRI